jgi:hypothetical protein
MPESQQAGFEFQKIIEKEVFGLDNPIQSYTAIHDIPKDKNKFNSTENISIKSSGSKTMCMGDPLRIFDYLADEKHTAIGIYYRQDGNNKVITKIVEFSLDNKLALFGDVTRDEIVKLSEDIRAVSQDLSKEELNKYRKIMNNRTKELSKRCAIRFNSKIDSKSQRRLQCSLTSIPESIIQQSENGPVVRGITITSSIISGKRVRNQK